MKSSRNPYAGYRYPGEIIAHAVWLYHRFCLSFRDVPNLRVDCDVDCDVTRRGTPTFTK
jgi:putative transposase